MTDRAKDGTVLAALFVSLLTLIALCVGSIFKVMGLQ